MTSKKRLGTIKRWLLANGYTTRRLKRDFPARGDLVPLIADLLPLAQAQDVRGKFGQAVTAKILMEALSAIRGHSNSKVKGQRTIRGHATLMVTNTKEEDETPTILGAQKTVSFKVIGDRAALLYAQVERMLNQYGAVQEDLTTLLRAIGDLESDLANASSALRNILKD